MTPIAERLRTQLDAETRRMHNTWFFKWHFIGSDGPVEIDDFRGGHIKYGGIKFFGTPRLVYWDTISFYLQHKITELFEQVENAIKDYPLGARIKAVDECQSVILGFVGEIKNAAVEKDRILRGDGFTFPAPDQTQRWDGSEIFTIQRQADGLREIYCQQLLAPNHSKEKQSDDEIISLKPALWGISVDLKAVWKWALGKWKTPGN